MLEEPMGITFWEYRSNKIEEESRSRQSWCCEAGVGYPRILNSIITRQGGLEGRIQDDKRELDDSEKMGWCCRRIP